MNPQASSREDDIKQLNNFLRNEKAAVETYQQCVEKIDDGRIAAALAELQQSHQQRVNLLSEKVQELGGSPETSSGTWGSFAKMMEAGAGVFGQKSALSALEEGEDRGVRNYQEKSDRLSSECRSFINSAIRPEQQLSHDRLSQIISTVQ